MSDAHEAIASETQVAATLEQSASAPVQGDNLSPGAVLCAARETQGLALERIADDLHLSKQVIEAIEADQYSVFSAPVFAKGHLRRYALRVGVSADDVIARYERLDANLQSRVSEPRLGEMTRSIDISAATASFRISPRAASHGGASRMQSMMWVIGALVLIGAFVWTVKDYLLTDKAAGSTAATLVTALTGDANSNQESSLPANVVTDSTDASHSPSALPAPSAILTQPVPQSAHTQTQAPTATASVTPTVAARNGDPSKLRIQLRFTQDSWVEITDATSKVMLYDVGRVDLPRVVDVMPPARVLLGNAHSVSVQVNGKLLTVPPHRVVSGVARFTINADGTVR